MSRPGESVRCEGTVPTRSRTGSCTRAINVRVEATEERHSCQDAVRPQLLSPSLRVDGDGARLVQALRDHHVAEGAIEAGYLDHVEALIRPVDVSCGGAHSRHLI